MKTMIPNTVRFDWDLQDLPARAIGVKQDDMIKLSGSKCNYNSIDEGGNATYRCILKGFFTPKDGNRIRGSVQIWDFQYSGNCTAEDAAKACNGNEIFRCGGICYASLIPGV